MEPTNHLLLDPLEDRVINTVPLPSTTEILDDDLIFKNERPNWKIISQHLQTEGKLSKL